MTLRLALHLSIVALVVLVEEALIVAIWRQFGIMQRLMIVSDPLDVLRRINNIGIMRRKIIGGLKSGRTVDSLVHAI